MTERLKCVPKNSVFRSVEAARRATQNQGQIRVFLQLTHGVVAFFRHSATRRAPELKQTVAVVLRIQAHVPVQSRSRSSRRGLAKITLQAEYSSSLAAVWNDEVVVK